MLKRYVDLSEEFFVSIFRTASSFSPEDGDSMFLLNVGIYLQIHTAKTNTDIFTAARTLNLI
jgi:hypothetical protein